MQKLEEVMTAMSVMLEPDKNKSQQKFELFLKEQKRVNDSSRRVRGQTRARVQLPSIQVTWNLSRFKLFEHPLEP